MRISTTTIAGALALAASPLAAEVTQAEDDHFITRNEAVVDATPKETWLALISPARWWASEHTWSADAANLSLTPQAGGCFCEKIPEVDEPGRFTLEGSVEHMRVIQAYPEVALRMEGALGPLQSEPVTGILTIAISPVENEAGETATRIVFEYNVGGQMRYPVGVISPAVDGVMTLQLKRLAELLGVVVAPVEAGGGPQESAADPDAAADAAEEAGGETVTIDPDDVIETPAEEAAEDDSPSAVDEAFDDLSEPG